MLDQQTLMDRQAIASGNLLSHIGDVLTDCYLYKNRIRFDSSTFKLLYGFPPDTVLDLCM